MWATERTEKNLKDTIEVLEELSRLGTEGWFKREVLKCLIQIAHNLGDISDAVDELNGYDLSDRDHDDEDEE